MTKRKRTTEAPRKLEDINENAFDTIVNIDIKDNITKSGEDVTINEDTITADYISVDVPDQLAVSVYWISPRKCMVQPATGYYMECSVFRCGDTVFSGPEKEGLLQIIEDGEVRCCDGDLYVNGQTCPVSCDEARARKRCCTEVMRALMKEHGHVEFNSIGSDADGRIVEFKRCIKCDDVLI